MHEGEGLEALPLSDMQMQRYYIDGLMFLGLSLSFAINIHTFCSVLPIPSAIPRGLKKKKKATDQGVGGMFCTCKYISVLQFRPKIFFSLGIGQSVAAWKTINKKPRVVLNSKSFNTDEEEIVKRIALFSLCYKGTKSVFLKKCPKHLFIYF